MRCPIGGRGVRSEGARPEGGGDQVPPQECRRKRAKVPIFSRCSKRERGIVAPLRRRSSTSGHRHRPGRASGGSPFAYHRGRVREPDRGKRRPSSVPAISWRGGPARRWSPDRHGDGDHAGPSRRHHRVGLPRSVDGAPLDRPQDPRGGRGPAASGREGVRLASSARTAWAGSCVRTARASRSTSPATRDVPSCSCSVASAATPPPGVATSRGSLPSCSSWSSASRYRRLECPRRADDDDVLRRRRARGAGRAPRRTRAPLRALLRIAGRARARAHASPAGPEHRRRRRPPGTVAIGPLRGRAPLGRPWEQLYSEAFVHAHPEAIEEDRGATARRPAGERRQAEAIKGWEPGDRLREIRAPVLVLHGTADRLVDPENARILAAEIPIAELVILEGAGHAFHSEMSERADDISWTSYDGIGATSDERDPRGGPCALGRARRTASGQGLRGGGRAARADGGSRVAVVDGPDGQSLEPLAAASGTERVRAATSERPRRTGDGRRQLALGRRGLAGGCASRARRLPGTRRRQVDAVVVADLTEGGEDWGDDVEVLRLEPGTGWASARNAGLRRSLGGSSSRWTARSSRRARSSARSRPRSPTRRSASAVRSGSRPEISASSRRAPGRRSTRSRATAWRSGASS